MQCACGKHVNFLYVIIQEDFLPPRKIFFRNVMKLVSRASIMSSCIASNNGVTFAETQLRLPYTARDEHASAVNTAIRVAVKSVQLGTTTPYVSSLKRSHLCARTFWGTFVSIRFVAGPVSLNGRTAKNMLARGLVDIQLT